MAKRIILGLLIFLAITLIFAREEANYWPTCNSPQNIAPMQNAGGSAILAKNSVVWNGKDYAVCWIDSLPFGSLYFMRFFADGTPLASVVNIPTGQCYSSMPPSLVWNGSGYGVAWMGWSGSYWQIFFAKLDLNGNIISGPTKVSFYGISETVNCYSPDLTYSGNGYCVTWYDQRNGDSDIFATLLDNNGAVTYSDTIISFSTNLQWDPRISWSSGISKYQIVWYDNRSLTKWEIYGSQISPSNVVTSNTLLVSGSSNSYNPAVSDMGNGLGMVWEDFRDGNWDIYFARLTSVGNKIGGELNISNDGNSSYYPVIVWTGAEFGVFWQDERSGNYETWFQRVSSSGSLLGSNLQVTYSGYMGSPGSAFAKYGYLATGTTPGGANYISAWGCNYPYFPPCPENFIAYNITGTSATISWLPSLDQYTDIAYYEVYRNNVSVGKTSETYFTDTGLSVSTTYNYAIRATNAAQITSSGCGSIYVKTNTTLTLMVNKNDPNAKLTWNDEGLNNYNVFRGTSPQVMGLIGNTSGLVLDDPNILLDNVNYFYTVDDPGQ